MYAWPSLAPLGLWRAHAAVFSAAAGAFCNLYCLQALLPLVQSHFSLGVSQAASLLTVTTLGLAVASPLAGRVGARIGPKAAVLGVLAALICSTVALSLVTDGNWLVFWRVLQGLIMPIGLSAILAGTASLWPGVAPVALAATYTTGVILGGLLGRFLPAALVPWGWTNAFLGFAGFQVLLAAVVVWLFPRAEPSRVPNTEPLLAWLRGLWPVVRHDIPRVVIGGFVLMVTQSAVTTYIAIRLAGEPFYWSTQALGALYVVFLPALVAVHMVPLAIQTRGSARTLAGATGASWAGLALTFFDHEVLILIGMTVVSACVFVVQTVLAHQVGAVAADRREKASSGYIAFYYLGASVGAQAPSLFWNSFGWTGCVAFVALAQACGLVLARLADRRSAGSGA